MAFPTIPTVAAGRVLSVLATAPIGTHTSPNLSSLTKNSGDLLIAIVIIYDGNSTNAEFSGWGGSFTEFVDQATTATMGIGAAYKWSTGSETGTFTVTSADISTNDSAFFLLSIPGAHASTPPEGGTIANGTSAAADPGSFNPAGWDAEDTLWIAVGGSGETSTTGSYTGIASAPTNYTNYADSGISADAVGGVEGAVAFRQLNAASEDVGAFSVDISNARNSALVIAIRPAAADTADAELANAAAAANLAAGSVGSSAIAAAATASANDATVTFTTNAQAELASATATANAVTATIDATIGLAAATVDAHSATPGISSNAEEAGASVAAYDATVSVPSGTDADAELAAATSAANDATAGVSSNADVAGSTAAAHSTTSAVDLNAAAAASIAAAYDATVSTASFVDANAGAATTIAAAYATAGSITPTAGVAAALASAHAATTTSTGGSVTASAGVASVSATAYGATVRRRRAGMLIQRVQRTNVYPQVAQVVARAYDAKVEWNDDEAAMLLLLDGMM